MDKVLITGSSYGIGRATSELFLKEGYIVWGLDTKPPSIKNDNYYHYQCDVTDINSLPTLYGATYIINNAGVLYEEEEPMKVNIGGVFNIEEKYIKTNLETLKAVVNAGSITVYDGQDNREYTCSKGALHAYTIYLCNELGKFGIRVNTIAPGSVYDEVSHQNILGRWGKPEESAEAIFFLCVKATFTTGSTLFIDGGELVKTRFVRSKDEVRPYDELYAKFITNK